MPNWILTCRLVAIVSAVLALANNYTLGAELKNSVGWGVAALTFAILSLDRRE